MDNAYHFVSHWRVAATCGEVADLLGDPLAFPQWWPSVYLEVRELAPAGPGGVGRRVALHTKGWLPYSIAWESTMVASRYPHGFAIEATGDFDGRGEWTFEQDGPHVNITYDWRIRAEKPLLRRLSFALRPLFAANHRWAMAQGEMSLELELQRRRATSAAARASVPAPPGPVTYAGVALLAGGALVGAGLAYWLLRRKHRPDRRRRRRT